METNIIVQEKTNDIAEFSIIHSKIRIIRGQSVMLDFDLAERYGVETKRLKEAVRRNIERFQGDDFMFELSKEEWESLRSQIATSNRGGIRYSPFAFTELGVAMLSSVLNSETAIDVSRKIMRAFVMLREYALNYADLRRELENVIARLDNNDKNFNAVFQALNELMKAKKLYENRTPIGFKQNK